MTDLPKFNSGNDPEAIVWVGDSHRVSLRYSDGGYMASSTGSLTVSLLIDDDVITKANRSIIWNGGTLSEQANEMVRCLFDSEPINRFTNKKSKEASKLRQKLRVLHSLKEYTR